MTAAVNAFHAHGSAITPEPTPAKKLRTSRHYFPSSPAVPAALHTPMQGIEYHNGIDVGPEGDIDDDHAIVNHALDGVWTGRNYERYSDSEDEVGGSDETVDDEDRDGSDEDCDSQDGLEDQGLSAMDLLGEEFEADTVANGTLFFSRHNY